MQLKIDENVLKRLQVMKQMRGTNPNVLQFLKRRWKSYLLSVPTLLFIAFYFYDTGFTTWSFAVLGAVLAYAIRELICNWAAAKGWRLTQKIIDWEKVDRLIVTATGKGENLSVKDNQT